jgi:hypothetical protein
MIPPLVAVLASGNKQMRPTASLPYGRKPERNSRLLWVQKVSTTVDVWGLSLPGRTPALALRRSLAFGC